MNATNRSRDTLAAPGHDWVTINRRVNLKRQVERAEREYRRAVLAAREAGLAVQIMHDGTELDLAVMETVIDTRAGR